jgi:L-fuconolactonase
MIDAHQHFWKYNPEEFSWLEGDFSCLRRDFLPEHLAETLLDTGVTGTISVQARRSLAETESLLELSDKSDFIRGVVGWVPLKEEGVGCILDRCGAHPRFKGVREILQGASDSEYFTNPFFNGGIRELTRRRLSYDLLIYPGQLAAATIFVEHHPDQIFILDHMAKPEIQKDFVKSWAHDIRRLATHPNVFCKLSGLVTEIKETPWDIDLLVPYFDVVLSAFGPKRLMFGSDWPVCLAKTDYARWLLIIQHLIASLSVEERKQITHSTATQVYKL